MKNILILCLSILVSPALIDNGARQITVKETSVYDNTLGANQTFAQFDVNDMTITTNNSRAIQSEISIGDNFPLLNAFILMEVNASKISDIEQNLQKSADILQDLYYNEDKYNTLEGAVYMSNYSYFESHLKELNVKELEAVLSQLDDYVSFTKSHDATSTIASITSSPLKLSQFVAAYNNKNLPLCEENMLYLNKLNSIVNGGETYQEYFIISEDIIRRNYINIGYKKNAQTEVIKVYHERLESQDEMTLSQAVANNLYVLQSAGEEYALTGWEE